MANPYELWSTRKNIGIMRDEKAEDWYFGQFFNAGTINSTDEWIDFEKLPIRSRRLAPFVKPLGKGRGILDDKVKGFRFKPANILIEEAIDPLRPLTQQPGITGGMLEMAKLSPMQKVGLIKAEMLREGLLATQRRWEWMKARAIIDGKVTCTYEDGAVALVDFQRAAGHTEVRTAGNFYGEAGVSILNHWQTVVDTMNNAEFGGFPTRITMPGAVATIVRKNAEVMEHMDINIRGASVTVERGLVSGGANGGKVYKFGELQIGGASGVRIELWVNDETYTTDGGTQQRYLAANEIVFTSTADAIKGYDCFGMIVDRDAEYQALPIFPKNYLTGDRVKTENISIESAPLFVPINANATYKATVIA